MDERDQTSWNLSEWKINLIGQLLTRATTEYLQQRSDKAFETWKQIALLIDNRLEPKEQEDLKLLEKKVKEKGMLSSPKTTKMGDVLIYTPLFNSLVMDYARFVNVLLKRVGMDIKTRDSGEEDLD